MFFVAAMKKPKLLDLVFEEVWSHVVASVQIT